MGNFLDILNLIGYYVTVSVGGLVALGFIGVVSTIACWKLMNRPTFWGLVVYILYRKRFKEWADSLPKIIY